MTVNLPYSNSPGNIKRLLTKIQEAATPSRFTQDFLETKLGLSGGSARPLIPFLKRIGFLGSDGTPTDIYKTFRNPTQSGAAAAEALRTGYSLLYEANEYAHELPDHKLKGLMVQLTGESENSRVLQLMVSSFKALKEFASHDKPLEVEKEHMKSSEPDIPSTAVPIPSIEHHRRLGLNLSYTINLNLPATSDISVFDAIFKSLKENLLKGQ